MRSFCAGYASLRLQPPSLLQCSVYCPTMYQCFYLTPQVGAAALAAMLRVNTAITQLDVSCNPNFGPEGCEQVRAVLGWRRSGIGRCLRACAAWRAMEVDPPHTHTPPPPSIPAQLRAAVESNGSLTQADMRQCGASEDDMLQLEDCLRARLERRERAKMMGR